MVMINNCETVDCHQVSYLGLSWRHVESRTVRDLYYILTPNTFPKYKYTRQYFKIW